MRPKIVALLLVLAGGLAIWKSHQPVSFGKVMEDDFKKLQASKSLPSGFSQIKNVEYTALSPSIQKYLEKNRPLHIDLNPKGNCKLEIMLDDLENGGVMVQYDLIDERGNTVWELGRTFNGKYFSER